MTKDRKMTPDILGSLLGDTKTEDTIKTEYHKAGIPEYHKDSKPVDQPTIKTVRKPTSKPVSQKAGKSVSAPGEKVKATYYIDAQAVEDLEAGWIQIRKMADKKVRGQISKSLIVELAIQMALEELKSKGSSSQIARRILKGT
jgi:hypothetical protein